MNQFLIVSIITFLCLTNLVAQTKRRTENVISPAGILPPRAVVLTTDCGAEMDDQWTLTQLALAPEFDLRGVVTTHAPSLAAPAAETSVKAVQEVLERLPLEKRPTVFAGSSVPLANRNSPLKNPGVNFIIEQAKSFSAKRPLAILVTGAATDVASALLMDSSLADRIEIIAMGFEKYPAGGDSWNVKNDVRAWQIILESRAPVTVGDAAVTSRDLRMTRSDARELLASRGIAGQYLADLHAAWLDRDPPFVEKVTGSRDTWIIWDQVTLAYLLGLTQQRNLPRPRLRDDLSFDFSNREKKRAKIIWVTAINSKRLWQHFVNNLDAANARLRNR